jgi:predicted O-linked N-acetylglucosamine transferase (SPINDLY family)
MRSDSHLSTLALCESHCEILRLAFWRAARSVLGTFALMSKTNEIWSRAAALHQQGKLAEALAGYDEFLRVEPKHAEALHYSGVAAYQAGDLGLALDRIRASVAIHDANPEAWSNLGLVLLAIGHKRAAVDVFEKAVRLDPASTEILANLASAQSAWGRHAEAEATARRVIAKDGTHAKAWFVIALALETQGRMLEALDAASRAAGFAPAVESYAGMKAQLENGIGAPDKARRTLETALARNPMSAALRFQLAGVLEYKLADLPAAEAAYEQVLRVDPRHGAALSQLAFLRGRLARWEGRDQLVDRYRAGVAASLPMLSPFAFLSLPSTRAEQRQCAQTWTAPLADVQPPAARRRILSPNRLRIGYLSADFHGHATAYLAAGLFEQHDRKRFEIFAYSTGPDDRSPMRARLVKAFDRFVDVRGGDPLAVADAIRGDGVDILVDLKGHTEGATPIVLALRPAPIQVHYLGYPGTLGGNLVDYMIGDPTVTPVEHAADYAEAIAMLPDSYQVNDRERPIAAALPRSETALPDGAFVFVSFNQTYKINPGVFDAWMAILAAVPDSVLWLLAKTDDDPAIANLRREAQARGIDGARLVFARHRPNAEYLALYRHADLFLDTWPYNAHTTASDALWAGCPVLTVLGTTFAGRVAASLLRAVGLPELALESTEQYVARAVALAADRGELARIKAHLAGPGRASALFDTVRTTRALEAAYAAMAEQHRRGERKSFRVDALPRLPAAP